MKPFLIEKCKFIFTFFKKLDFLYTFYKAYIFSLYFYTQETLFNSELIKDMNGIFRKFTAEVINIL